MKPRSPFDAPTETIKWQCPWCSRGWETDVPSRLRVTYLTCPICAHPARVELDVREPLALPSDQYRRSRGDAA